MRRTPRQAPDSVGIRSGRIPLTSLVQFLSVAEHLNFHHAANVLHVSQPTVSRRIRLLEETLGLNLFERRHRGVRLTEAGQRFAIEVSAGIDHLDQAVRTAGAVAAGAEGTLRIGLHMPIVSGFLYDLKSHYRALWPGIEQTIVEGRSSETLAMVRDGRLDVAFVIGPVASSDCHSRLLWTEPLFAVLPATHALAGADTVRWDDLAPELFLIRQGGSGPQAFDYVAHRMAERGRTPRVQRCDVGRDTVMGMVAAGDGITITSEAATCVTMPGIVFKKIADEPEPVRFTAVWLPQNRSPALRNFLDLAVKMSRERRSV
jgi:DNA-binding transcriptional LysR family regulator